MLRSCPRVTGVVSATLLAALAVCAAPAFADDDAAPTVTVGGYVQPQLRIRQDSAVQPSNDGFRLVHVRPAVRVTRDLGCFKTFAYVELDTTPSVALLDGYVGAAGDFDAQSGWWIAAGQVKAPFSRQTLLSDADMQFPEKAQLTTITPDRQLGASATVNLPWLPMVELSAGLSDGEGKNLGENQDRHLLFAGRLALRPIGPRAKIVESALGDDAVSLAGSFARNVQSRGDFDETITSFGADAFVSWRGVSGTAEWVRVAHTFGAGSPEPDFHAQGLNVQLGWLLPLPGVLRRRVEIAGRVEEIDRNDTVAIAMPGSPDQSVRQVVVGSSYYHRGHDLKVQASFAHIVELEDRTAGGQDATFPNDTFLLQVTFKL